MCGSYSQVEENGEGRIAENDSLVLKVSLPSILFLPYYHNREGERMLYIFISSAGSNFAIVG